MTYDEAKHILEHYELDVMRINALKDKMRHLRERLEVVGSVITGMPRVKRSDDIFASTFANIEYIEAEIIRLTRRLTCIDAAIAKMPEPYHAVLVKRYCMYQTIEAVADEMKVSTRTIRRRQDKGINIFSTCPLMSLNVHIDM